MFTEHYGDAILEWMVVAMIAVAVMGAALYGVFQSISAKLNAVNTQIGS